MDLYFSQQSSLEINCSAYLTQSATLGPINLNKVFLSRKVKITVLRQASSTLMICST